MPEAIDLSGDGGVLKELLKVTIARCENLKSMKQPSENICFASELITYEINYRKVKEMKHHSKVLPSVCITLVRASATFKLKQELNLDFVIRNIA